MHVSRARSCDRTLAHRASARRSFFVHPSSRSGSRSGVALVLFALLVFAFMGIAALTIDMGIASLTQAEMQNAVDTASLEGVRLRDFGPYRVLSNKARRPRVSELVQEVFDDDLHPTSGFAGVPGSPSLGGIPAMPPDDSDKLQIGAGPIWSLVNGDSTDNVGAKLDTHDHNPVYDDPVLQTNYQNLNYGDMLSGEYSIYSNHTEHSGGNTGELGNNYIRDDYTPAATFGPDWKSLAFLVRMRRTNGSDASDNQSGVSTGGPSLPFVFGLGMPMHGEDPSNPEVYNPRTQGVNVRAVAIAAARPAMAVGVPPMDGGSPAQPLVDRIGAAMLGIGFFYPPPPAIPDGFVPPLAMNEEFWNGMALHQSNTLIVHPDKTVSAQSAPAAVVGKFIDPNRGRSVGESLTASSDLPTNVDTSQYGCYFPIYAPITDPSGVSISRVIGYGYGVMVFIDSTHWSVSKGFQNKDDIAIGSIPACAVLVAPDNATAHLTKLAPQLTKDEWQQLFDAHSRFAYPDYVNSNISFDWQKVRPGTVMAPVLVR